MQNYTKSMTIVSANQPVIYDEAILTPRLSGGTEDIWHSVLDPSKVLETAAARVVRNNSEHCNNSVFSKEKTVELLNSVQ